MYVCSDMTPFVVILLPLLGWGVTICGIRAQALRPVVPNMTCGENFDLRMTCEDWVDIRFLSAHFPSELCFILLSANHFRKSFRW